MDKLEVEALSLMHLKAARESFDRAIAETLKTCADMDTGPLPSGSKVELTLKITFAPDSEGDHVEVTCQGTIKGPKYPADSVHALNRRGQLKVVNADQGELPGIKGRRTVALVEDN
jgi:hypothetical protein